MFFSRKSLLPILIGGAALAGCTKAPEAGPRVVAVIPFENLTPDRQFDWLSRAVSNILAAQTHGPRFTSFEVGAARDVTAARATEIVQGYFEPVQDKLRLVATVQKPATNRILRTETAEGALDAGVLPLIEAIARKLAPDIKPYASRNEEAVRLLFQSFALSASERIKPLERAVELDPSFGPAWLFRFQTLQSLKDPGAAAILEQAAAHAGSFRDIDRAQLDLLRASDPAKRAAAMEEVARVSADAEVWRQLAEYHVLRKQFAGAAKAYEEALEIDPNNIANWNQLGYVHAFNADLPAAVKALERYRTLAPADPNALDSLGEVHFMNGRFSEAQRYFEEAHAKNSGIVNGGEPFRAALAKGLAGDKAAARKLFEKYLAARPQDPAAPIREALFLFMIGEDKLGEEKLLQTNSAAARAQLAVWYGSRHEVAKARELAQAAARDAKTPAEKTLAAIAFATASDSARNLPKNIEAFRLLFQRSPEAEAIWRSFYDETPATGASEARVMLLWAMKMNGKDAPELKKTYPLPPQHPEAGFAFLTIPKFVELKR